MNYSDYRVRKYWGEKQNLFNIFTIWGFGTACSDNITLPYAKFDFKEYWSNYNPETKKQNNTGSGISNQVEIKSTAPSKQKNTASSVATPGETTPVNASSATASSGTTENLTSADKFWDILTIIKSLLSPQQLPYAVLVLLAGGGLALFINRTVSPKKDKQKDKNKL
jgi:hypothetical protein